MHQEVKIRANRSFNYTEEKQVYQSICCMYVVALESAIPNRIQEAGFSGFRVKIYHRAGSCCYSSVESGFIVYLICSNNIYQKRG